MAETTELVVAGGTSDEIRPVADVAEDLELVARSPAEMRTAQASLAEWAKQKVLILERDLAELCNSIDIAVHSGWETKALDRQEALCRRRIAYYKKIEAAVRAGYCIVPNFPLDIFAIRTKRTTPRKQPSDSRFSQHLQHSESPPLGEGHHVRDVPTQSYFEYEDKDREGKIVTKREYFADEFTEVEFPISLAKPAVMSATAEAMALNCFDEIGCLPARRGKGDPVVCGVIYDPRETTGHWRNGRRRVTFLLAWYLDTREL